MLVRPMRARALHASSAQEHVDLLAVRAERQNDALIDNPAFIPPTALTWVNVDHMRTPAPLSALAAGPGRRRADAGLDPERARQRRKAPLDGLAALKRAASR